MFHPLRVAQVERIATDSAAVTFDVPPALQDAFRFEPGQWVGVRRVVDGRQQRRSYSICTPSDGRLRIGVRELGDFSRWLVRGVRPGYPVEVAEPAGSFGIDLADSTHPLFVAAGSGITPILSMVSSRLRDPAVRVRLICLDREPAGAMFLGELDGLQAAHPDRLAVTRVWTRTSGGGRPDAAGWRALLAEAGPDAWLCGPALLLRRLQAILTGLGTPADRIRTEVFDAARDDPAGGPEVSAGACTVSLTYRGVSSEIAIAPDEWLLDGVLAVREDIPFSCMSGTCGSCRALVRSGQVVMVAQQALSRQEVRAGYVLTCLSRSTSPAVSLDYDARP